MKLLYYGLVFGLCLSTARAHDPYEITSAVYVRSNVIELFIEMECPTGLTFAGVTPQRDVAALTQFEQARAQLTALAGNFFDFTAGNNRVAALTTNIFLGVEDHIQLKVEYAATTLRPLQFTARGLRTVTDAPYGTSLTVLDMVNQKVLGQTTLFALSPRADFPPASAETNESPALAPNNANPASAAATITANPTNPPSGTNALTPLTPMLPDEKTDWFIVTISLVAVVFIVFAFFRRR